jgi:hypothetical protein
VAMCHEIRQYLKNFAARSAASKFASCSAVRIYIRIPWSRSDLALILVLNRLRSVKCEDQPLFSGLRGDPTTRSRSSLAVEHVIDWMVWILGRHEHGRASSARSLQRTRSRNRIRCEQLPS